MRIVDIAFLELDKTVLEDIGDKSVTAEIGEVGVHLYYIDATAQELEHMAEKAKELNELFEGAKKSGHKEGYLIAELSIDELEKEMLGGF